MAIYNSFGDYNQNDPNQTLISSSMLNDIDKSAINACIAALKLPQQANKFFNKNQPTVSNPSGDQDYVFLEHDSHEKIEQILHYYGQELEQESQSQLDCTRKLIIRLVDFIRPCYSLNERKLRGLNELFNEISSLHDKKSMEQKNKNQELQSEISRLEKFIITSTNPYNSKTNVYATDLTFDYDEWMKLEEETIKLRDLVERQTDKINELITLLSDSDTFTHRTSQLRSIIGATFETERGQQPPSSSSATVGKPFPSRAPIYPPLNSGTNLLQTTNNRFHLRDPVNNEAQNEGRPTVTTNYLSPLSRKFSCTSDRKCPICNYQFHNTANEFEIITHVDRCFIEAGMDDLAPYPEPKQYECPKCNQQFPCDHEKEYREHLSDCYA
ncbi:unnamed protein product [Rotaria magnacalcarata]|uniref:UBZ1-type domain-containing protein n=1 Tax=Rotaria magnacalcarata TaxID=392030 RepID=A0A816PUX1_9BILA|nr:unnamed protein product [Rotaria magnacalcarata]CAF1602076.1 unnamed protein product [Rotaria magnacalcarata]CAF1602090.1 unnamed protein product [Rotaria magnacalcarata]CAF2054178.1 unnamed protein product [Rotaria magnacalcarata]